MGIVDVFRRFVLAREVEDVGVEVASSVTAGVGLEQQFDFDDIIAKLQMAKMEVDRVKYQLVEEVRALKRRLIEALRRRDRDAVQINAAELVLKKKMLAAISTYSRLLELTIARVHDARSIEALAKALAPLEYALRAMDDYLSATSPEVAARLASVVETAERVVRGTSFMASNMPRAPSPAELDPEVQREIAMVIAEVRREMKELLPDVDDIDVSVEPRRSGAFESRASKTSRRLSDEELERRLLDYIKSSGGVIKISEASRRLGVAKEDVVRALRRLSEKGLISIEEGEASTA